MKASTWLNSGNFSMNTADYWQCWAWKLTVPGVLVYLRPPAAKSPIAAISPAYMKQ